MASCPHWKHDLPHPELPIAKDMIVQWAKFLMRKSCITRRRKLKYGGVEEAVMLGMTLQ
jgi:hypothetical protein